MAERFIRVTDEYLAELEDTARRFFDLVEELQQAVAVPVVSPKANRSKPDSPAPEGDRSVAKPPARDTPTRRYTIGRSGEWEYAEVVWREYSEPVFNAPMAWKAIEGLVETDAKRPTDSLRVSLDRDPRFQRIKNREGAWWRRVDPNQVDLMSEEETPASG